MPKFKKFSGNYPQIVDALQLSTNFYHINKSRKEYNHDVAKDLRRFSYLNYNGTVDVMMQRLADTRHLKNKELSYTQGNFFAGVFTQSAVKALPAFIETTNKAAEKGTLENYTGSLSFTYVDDEGALCGFSLTYLRDDSNQDIPVAKRPKPFMSAVIKNVNHAPDKREVNVFSHHSLLSKNNKSGENLSTAELNAELKKAINCQKVSQLLTSIIDQETIVLVPFLNLDKRLVCAQNIDDRDKKLAKLFELFVISAQLAASPKQCKEKNKLIEKLTTLVDNAYQDVNFFKDKELQDIVNKVNSYKKHPLIASLPKLKNPEALKQTLMQIVQDYQVHTTAAKAQLDKTLEQYATQYEYTDFEQLKARVERSFVQRHLASLVLLSITILAVISFALFLSGILVPIGASLIAGLTASLAVASGSSSALIVAASHETEIKEIDVNYRKEIEILVEHHPASAQQVKNIKDYKQTLSKALESLEVDESSDAKHTSSRTTSLNQFSLGKSNFTSFGKNKFKTEEDNCSIEEPNNPKAAI